MKKLGLLSLFLASAVLGCDVYDANLLTNGTAQVPPPPDPSTSSPNDSVEVLFTLRDVFLKQTGEQGRNIGLDLDDRNTTDRDNVECTPPDDLVDSVLDGTRGIDNSLGLRILPTLPLAVPCIEDDIALSHGVGFGTLVALVSKWNGLSDDAEVEVTITQAWEGTSEDPECLAFGGEGGTELVQCDPLTCDSGTCTPTATLAADPAWDGDDYWYIDRRDFNNNTTTGEPDRNLPKNPQQGAYITKNRLVIELLPRFPIRFAVGRGLGSLEIVLSDAFLFADIANESAASGDGGTDGGVGGDTYEISFGAIAGRFLIEDLKAATPSIGICGILAQGQEAAFNTAADVMALPGSGGPNALCNAISIGISFTGMEGQYAGMAPVGAEADASALTCPAPAEDPRNFCCPSNTQAPDSIEDCEQPDLDVYTSSANWPVKPPAFALEE